MTPAPDHDAATGTQVDLTPVLAMLSDIRANLEWFLSGKFQVNLFDERVAEWKKEAGLDA